MSEQTVQCPICKTPYKTYPGVGDQSACPKCVNAASANRKWPDGTGPYVETTTGINQ